MNKLTWTRKSQHELVETLSYWLERNGSSSYSKKLLTEVLAALNFLSQHPNAGKSTNIDRVRTKLIAEHFILIYRLNQHHISILRFWDTRRNPKAVKRYFK